MVRATLAWLLAGAVCTQPNSELPVKWPRSADVRGCSKAVSGGMATHGARDLTNAALSQLAVVLCVLNTKNCTQAETAVICRRC